MGLKKCAAMVGVPGGDAVFEAALGQRIHLRQPGGVAGDLPVAEHLHDAAQLAVGGGVPVWSTGPSGMAPRKLTCPRSSMDRTSSRLRSVRSSCG